MTCDTCMSTQVKIHMPFQPLWPFRATSLFHSVSNFPTPNMSVCMHANDLQPSQFTIVQIIELVSATFSLFGSSATMISYLFLNRRIRGEKTVFQLVVDRTLNSLVFWLAVADFFLSASIIASQLWLLIRVEDYTFIACKSWITVNLYFILASYFWTSSIAFELQQQASPKFSAYQHKWHLLTMSSFHNCLIELYVRSENANLASGNTQCIISSVGDCHW